MAQVDVLRRTAFVQQPLELCQAGLRRSAVFPPSGPGLCCELRKDWRAGVDELRPVPNSNHTQNYTVPFRFRGWWGSDQTPSSTARLCSGLLS